MDLDFQSHFQSMVHSQGQPSDASAVYRKKWSEGLSVVMGQNLCLPKDFWDA